MNRLAGASPIGANGLSVLPFGNGAERVLGNRDIGATVEGVNLNIHHKGDLYRAGQEGIVFALKYGFDIMKNMGLKIRIVKAGKANMFLSPVFREAFAHITGAVVRLYNTDGSQGAARGAGIGAGIYKNFKEAFTGLKLITEIEPEKSKQSLYKEAYERWEQHLNNKLK